MLSTVSVLPPSFFTSGLNLSSAGPSRQSRRASGMQVRPLELVRPAALFQRATLPIHLQQEDNSIFPCNTTLTAKELKMYYQPAPKLGLLPS